MDKIRFNRLLRKMRYSRGAVKELYEFYFPAIVRHIRRNFHGKLDGRDIAQELFVRLMQKDNPERIRCPTAWVYRFADNIAVEALRKDGKRKTAEANSAVPDKAYQPEPDTEILDGLNTVPQQIMYLRYWERYTLKEIAGVLKMNYSTVKSAHRSAKERIRKKLKPGEIPLQGSVRERRVGIPDVFRKRGTKKITTEGVIEMYDDKDNFNDQFETWLGDIAGFIRADENGNGFLTGNGKPRRPPDPRAAFDSGFMGALSPAQDPPLKSAEFARQIAVVLRDEFVADIAVRGSVIRVILPDRTFVVRVGKAL